MPGSVCSLEGQNYISDCIILILLICRIFYYHQRKVCKRPNFWELKQRPLKIDMKEPASLDGTVVIAYQVKNTKQECNEGLAEETEKKVLLHRKRKMCVNELSCQNGVNEKTGL